MKATYKVDNFVMGEKTTFKHCNDSEIKYGECCSYA